MRGLLRFLRLCGNDCYFVIIVRSAIRTTAKFGDVVMSLDAFINRPALQSRDNLDILFQEMELISSAKDRLQAA